MSWESFDEVRFDLGPFHRGQMSIAKSKVLINCFFWVLEVCNVKASYRKSCARNLAPLSRSNEDSQIKSVYNSLIHVPRGLQCHTNLLEVMG